MSIIKNNPTRKTIFRSERSLNLDTYENVILSESFYSTFGENLIIVKDVENCKIKLDSTTTNKITIKSLTNCRVIPDIGRVDDEWDEIELSKGACVKFQNVNNIWYILSSDGLKLDN